MMTIRAGAILRVLALGLWVGLAACTVGPVYETPEMAVGDSFRQIEQGHEEGWRPVDPKPVETDWWRQFEVAEFEQWVPELLAHNADLEQAQARYRAAQAALKDARSAWWPNLGAQSSAQRSGSGRSGAESQYNLSANVSWELDVWGRVRQQVSSSDARLQASAADLAGAELSLIATFVQSYFQYQRLQRLHALYEQAVRIYSRSLEITQNRYEAGLSARSDVDSAITQRENALVQQQTAARQLSQMEHALAVLLGQAPSVHELAPKQAEAQMPAMPISIPSALLERRPDIVAAERRVAAANAEIGVAQTAWFPEFSFNLQGGYRSSSWSEWITTPARFWSLGPALALSIFDGGARRARVEQAQAQYDEAVGHYKQTVLEALQEVEDLFADWQGLERERQSQERALDAARRALQSMQEQYAAGMVDYLSLAQVENSTLSTEQAMLNLENEQLQVAVRLFAALGGGWSMESAAEHPVL